MMCVAMREWASWRYKQVLMTLLENSRHWCLSCLYCSIIPLSVAWRHPAPLFGLLLFIFLIVFFSLYRFLGRMCPRCCFLISGGHVPESKVYISQKYWQKTIPPPTVLISSHQSCAPFFRCFLVALFLSLKVFLHVLETLLQASTNTSLFFVTLSFW